MSNLDYLHETDEQDDNIPEALYKRIKRTPRAHRDGDILEQLYVDEELSQSEIGSLLNVDQATISRQLRANGIETRSAGRDPIDEHDRKNLYRLVSEGGKVTYLEHEGEPNRLIAEHQLVALHDFSVSEVFDPETHVHHLMAAPHAVDLPANLTVLDGREHIRRHAEGTACDDPETVLQHIFEEFQPFAEGDNRDDG